MKINLSPRKPRNPLVAAAPFRCAGAHQSSRRTARQEGARMLRRELDRLKPHSP